MSTLGTLGTLGGGGRGTTGGMVGRAAPAEAAPAGASSLLHAAGIRNNVRITRLPGGKNNRVFRVDSDARTLLLKAYFRHPSDPRDRLGAEFAFSHFAWRVGLRALPEPVAQDREHELGLYEFVAGRHLMAGEVTAHHMSQALGFWRDLNRHKARPEAVALPLASEACFTADEHVRCVARRVDRLAEIDGASSVDGEARRLVGEALVPRWEHVRAAVYAGMAALDLAPGAALHPGDRCLSPSDFGFHNALLTSGGALRFVDFEYAGWDDPAKMVCDFFCQVAVPVPAELFGAFAEAAASCLSEPDVQLRRFTLLLPLYRVKWCCILLNDFLPVAAERRRFSDDGDGGTSAEERKVEQLRKAQALMSAFGP